MQGGCQLKNRTSCCVGQSRGEVVGDTCQSDDVQTVTSINKVPDFFSVRSRTGAMKRNDSPSAMICFAPRAARTLQMVGVLAVPAGGQKTKTREFCAVHGSQGKRGAPCYFTPDRSQHAACIGDIAMADWCVGKVTSRPGFISLAIDHK